MRDHSKSGDGYSLVCKGQGGNQILHLILARTPRSNAGRESESLMVIFKIIREKALSFKVKWQKKKSEGE